MMLRRDALRFKTFLILRSKGPLIKRGIFHIFIFVIFFRKNFIFCGQHIKKEKYKLSLQIFRFNRVIILPKFSDNKMPRDKKSIHRATSDVEDEEISDTEVPVDEQKDVKVSDQSPTTTPGLSEILEERKKFLKEAILKRTLALKQQRERKNYQSVKSTKTTT